MTQHSTNTSLRTSRRVALMLLCIAWGITGCNLAVDVDQYPYQIIIKDMPADTPEDTKDDIVDMPADLPPDMPDMVDMPDDMKDMPPDMPPPKPPKLIFTEVMIQSTKNGSNEYGEFIEVANIGEMDADPKKIVIRLDTNNQQDISIRQPPGADADEQAQFAALKPIKQGEHFVFVRDDDVAYGVMAETSAGASYEWRWVNISIGLTNNNERNLTLIYDNVVHDKVGWNGGAWGGADSTMPEATLTVKEGESFSLNPNSYSETANDDPKAWCYGTNAFGARNLKGTPGSKGTCP